MAHYLQHNYNGTHFRQPPKQNNNHNNVKITNISVTVSVHHLKFIPDKEQYEITINDAVIISTNSENKSVTIAFSSKQMKKINKELADDDIDQLLDEIEMQNDFIRNRDQQLLALQLFQFDIYAQSFILSFVHFIYSDRETLKRMEQNLGQKCRLTTSIKPIHMLSTPSS